MAAALAANVLPRATIESAGWAPGESVAQNTVSVVREMTGSDISDHQPRDLSEVDSTSFDLVVVLDPHVLDDLHLPPETNQVVWDVPDPYGSTLDEYRRCAEDLRQRIAERSDEWR
jgi:protein-tyrosine-phosphatase